MSYINKVSTDGTTHLIEPTLFAAAEGTSSAYTAAIGNFTLVDGVAIYINFGTANNYGATLNINELGEKPINYKGSVITANLIKADHTYNLVYDGTNWNITGDISPILNNGTITFDTRNSISPVTTISWNGMTNSIAQTVAGTSTDVISLQDMGLSKALRFIGITTTDMAVDTNNLHDDTINSYTGKPTITNLNSYTPAVGDVVINNTNADEWVCVTANGTSSVWERLGSDTSYKIVQSSVTDANANTSTNATTTFVQAVTQNNNGEITVTKAPLDTTGNWEGTAATATAADLTTSKYGITYYNDTTGTFAGTGQGSAGYILIGGGSNNAPSWQEILPVVHGGTGVTNFTDDCIITSTTSSSTQTLVSRGLKVTGSTSQDIILTTNKTNGSITISPNGTGTITIGGTLNITGNTSITNGTLTVAGDTALQSTLTVDEVSNLLGNVGIGMNADTSNNGYTLSVNGNAEFNGNLIPTIPSSANATPDKTLGSSDNHWAKLYIGTNDTHGDQYTPIYWNEGVPSTVKPVQHIDFSFTATALDGTSSASFSQFAAIGADTTVLDIVVTSGWSYLNGLINWDITTSGTTSTLTLSANTNIPSNHSIEGYVIISHTAIYPPLNT